MKNFNKILTLILSIYNVIYNVNSMDNEEYEAYNGLGHKFLEHDNKNFTDELINLKINNAETKIKTENNNNTNIINQYYHDKLNNSYNLFSETSTTLPSIKQKQNIDGTNSFQENDQSKLDFIKDEFTKFVQCYNLKLPTSESITCFSSFRTLYPLWDAIDQVLDKKSDLDVYICIDLLYSVLNCLYNFIYELANLQYRWKKDDALCAYFAQLLDNSILDPKYNTFQVLAVNPEEFLKDSDNNKNTMIYIMYKTFNSLQNAIHLFYNHSIDINKEKDKYETCKEEYNSLYNPNKAKFKEYNDIIHQYKNLITLLPEKKNEFESGMANQIQNFYNKYPGFKAIESQANNKRNECSVMKCINKAICDKLNSDKLLSKIYDLNSLVQYCANKAYFLDITDEARNTIKDLLKNIKKIKVKTYNNAFEEQRNKLKYYKTLLLHYILFTREMLEQVVKKYRIKNDMPRIKLLIHVKPKHKQKLDLNITNQLV